MTEIIHAWISDPSGPSLFKRSANSRSALFVLTCERKEECDLFAKCNQCLHQGMNSRCPYGNKSHRSGLTRRAKKFYSQMSDWRKQCEDHFGKLKAGLPPNRVFKIGDYWLLPYSHMVKGVWGSGFPLDSEWVPLTEMNTELMTRILTARVYSESGGEISTYQKESVPKFLVDIRANYPELWDLVPEDQKARLGEVDYKGRKAVLATCLPGVFDGWSWDGTYLSKDSPSVFLPIKGTTRITPVAGAEIKITDNATVGAQTEFVD